MDEQIQDPELRRLAFQLSDLSDEDFEMVVSRARTVRVNQNKFTGRRMFVYERRIWKWLYEVCGFTQRSNTSSDCGRMLPALGLFNYGRAASRAWDGRDNFRALQADITERLEQHGATHIHVVGYHYEGDGEGFYYVHFMPPAEIMGDLTEAELAEVNKLIPTEFTEKDFDTDLLD